jgi:hypothetical protein
MTTAKPPARYSAVEGALAGGSATAELHHPQGHDPASSPPHLHLQDGRPQRDTDDLHRFWVDCGHVSWSNSIAMPKEKGRACIAAFFTPTPETVGAVQCWTRLDCFEFDRLWFIIC